VIEDALAHGSDGLAATDDAMMAERIGHPVTVVMGDERNFKITTQGDLTAARASLVAAPRIGTGYDLHRLVAHRPLVLAGLVLPFDRGPLAHSDGDVICHALVDAILGAAGAGDVGRHFPNTDPAWKDAPGLDLLARALKIAALSGWRPSSVDVTVILERPKLAPHIDEIRRRLADVLGLAVDAIGLKGKTNEESTVGRGEAIAALAVAVLVAGAPR
jgi:2-C-methyl-D-erythritol 2,4-cyclodiphosphate synthase